METMKGWSNVLSAGNGENEAVTNKKPDMYL